MGTYNATCQCRCESCFVMGTGSSRKSKKEMIITIVDAFFADGNGPLFFDMIVRSISLEISSSQALLKGGGTLRASDWQYTANLAKALEFLTNSQKSEGK